MALEPEIIYIQGVYPYEIPAEPEDKTLILNHEIEDIKEQKWRTPELPDFKKMSAYEMEQWIEREDERMANGVWFYNNGEVVYINGAHYEYLTYWKCDYVLRFWHVDRLYFYFDEFVDNYGSCFGKAIYKPRAGGFTAKENFLAYRKSKSAKGMHVALINSTIENATLIQYKVIRDAHLQYPHIFRPRIKSVNGRIPETGMDYVPTMENDSKKYLRGWLKPFAPKANSLDGKRTHRIFCDEISKWESIDPEKIITPYLKTYFNPSTQEIQGRMVFVSTLGTDDALMKKAIEFYLQMWRNSNIEEIDEQGYTRSKFLRYFINCYEVFDIDDYGFANHEQAVLTQEEKLNGLIKTYGEYSTQHILELRENPRTIDDITKSPKVGSSFDVGGRVSKQIDITGNIPVAERGIIRGKYVMSDSGIVHFDTSPEYMEYGWEMSTLIGGGKGLFKKYGGKYFLHKKPDGTVGYDQVRYGQPTSTHFSQPAIIIYQKNDLHTQNGKRNQILGLYYGRKEDNDEVNEQALYAAIYWGFILCPERNVGLDWFLRGGYEQLIPISWYDNGRGIMITTGTGEKNVLEHGIKAILKWVIGRETSKAKDGKETIVENISTLFFMEVLNQLKSFTADKLNTHDVIAAFLQAKLVADKMIPDELQIVARNPSIMKSMYHSFSAGSRR